MNKKIIMSIVFFIFFTCICLIITQYVQNKSQDITELETIKLSELADYYYKAPRANGFVDETEEKYRSYYKVADSVEDAIEKSKKVISYSTNNEIIELSLQKETEYYYVIYEKYISHRNINDTTFENSYVYFKSTVLNLDNKIINTQVIDDVSKVKEVLNLYTYLKISSSAGEKLLFPKIKETTNNYIYTYYKFVEIGGDYGIADVIKLYKVTVKIDKLDGKFESVEKEIRKVKGKIN